MKKAMLTLMAVPNVEKCLSDLKHVWATHEEAKAYSDEGFIRFKKLKEGVHYKLQTL